MGRTDPRSRIDLLLVSALKTSNLALMPCFSCYLIFILLTRDHEIDPDISTPERNHIRFPERAGGEKLASESSRKKNLKKKGVSLENYAGKGVSAKPLKGVDKLSSSSVRGDLSENRVEKSPVQAPSKRKKLSANGNSFGKSKKSEIRAGEICSGEMLFVAHGENEMIQMIKPTTKRTDNSLRLDDETRSR